jgi:hypothetical protein
LNLLRVERDEGRRRRMRANNPLLEQAAGQKESSSKKWGCENTSRDGRFSPGIA